MSRKSRQKKGRSTLAKLPPVWVLIPMLILGLGVGILCVAIPRLTQPTPYKDTIPLSATMTEVEGEYRSQYPRRHRELNDIFLYFSDHDRLIIPDVIASESLLEKLDTYPAGTVFDMRLDPNGIDVITLSLDSAEVLDYETACRAHEVNDGFGFAFGIFMLIVAIYAAWGLFMTWKYRRLA